VEEESERRPSALSPCRTAGPTGSAPRHRRGRGARRLPRGVALVEAAGAIIKPDVARWWTADDTFLDLVRDRAAVNAMLSEVAGQAVADANLSETAKVQKKILCDCLNGEGRERIDGWAPRYMAFPLHGYDANKTIQSPPTGRPLRLCLPGNDAGDSGAEVCSVPECGAAES
jgi:hypothetical protein